MEASANLLPEHFATLRDLVAGTIAGSVGIVVGQPVDRVKVLKQTGAKSTINTSVYQSLATLVRTEGTRSLWKGCGAPLLGAAPINALVFAANGKASRFLEANEWFKSHHSLHPSFVSTNGTPYASYFVSGCFGGAIQSIVAGPSELIKCKLQVLPAVSNNQSINPSSPMRSMINHIYRSEGLLGFTRGLGVTALRDTHSYGVYFLAYEVLKDQFTKLQYRNKPSIDQSTYQPAIPSMLFAGGFAGMISWVTCFPVDVVKTTIQTSESKMGIMKTITSNYSKHGASFFFKGLNATMMRAFVVNSVTFAVYETVIASIPFPSETLSTSHVELR